MYKYSHDIVLFFRGNFFLSKRTNVLESQEVLFGCLGLFFIETFIFFNTYNN